MYKKPKWAEGKITEYSEFAIPYIYRHSKDVGQDIKQSSVWSGVETES